jgi:hypothetical protein
MSKKTIEEDELILQAYNIGWDECFGNDNSTSLSFEENSILRTAYNIGWSDYIAGDDVSSIDLQTKDEIINNIKRIHKLK